MRRSTVFRASFILFLLLALTASISLAQESDPDSEPTASVVALQTVHAVSGNAFTYQGQLLHDGESVDGLCAFEFSLWDDADIGNQVGASVKKEDVPVTEGLFTVQLDFGSSAFNGAARYLDIKVDCGGSLIALTPRQPITAVPYALYAKKVVDGPGSGLNADLLDGQQATAFAESDHDHNTDYWSLSGNAGTTPGTHFLGTTDQQALEFHVNGARVLRIEPSNNAPNFIGGVSINQVVQGVYGATIAGGGNAANQNFNYVTDNLGTVSGGSSNTAGNDGVVTDDAEGATVGGGAVNWAEHKYATVGGGYGGQAMGEYSTIAGGYSNTASHLASIGGGYNNIASGQVSTIGGGSNNQNRGDHAAVGGGEWNEALGDYASVGGGGHNLAKANYATIAGGGPYMPERFSDTNNRVVDDYGTVGGGGGNTAGDDDGDTENNQYATVAGGRNNHAKSKFGTIGGGLGNEIIAPWATIAGGSSNSVGLDYGAIGGGYSNWSTGHSSTIGGGNDNEATGDFSTVPGGNSNQASGNYSFAAGHNAKARHNGSFVWADSQIEDFESDRTNQFKVRASGGVTFETDDAAFQVDSASMIYLSPHDMVVRGNTTGLTLRPLDNGGMRITNTSAGSNVTRYFSVPFSTFGTLFGAPIYVKGLEVCYQSSAQAYIDVTAMLKNDGGTGTEGYLAGNADLTSLTHDCYTIGGVTPSVIDNSSWVQFNVHFDANGGEVTIYTVKVTLTESPS